MAKTIIQTIGPLYGEVVNGTVFGRPNGSIFVPAVNTISLAIGVEYVISADGSGGTFAGWLYPANSAGVPQFGKIKLSAESQDTAAYMAIQISDDVDFGTYDQDITPAGQFNLTRSSLRATATGNVTITNGTTYYCRAVLYASSGVPVAYSSVVTLTGVAE